MMAETPHDVNRTALFTDLYELTMAQAYHAEGMEGEAVFELFFREMPRDRNYVIAAGLASIIDYLENWRFTEEELSYLADQDELDDRFLDWLSDLRFTGDIFAVPEGTLVFPNEPIVQVVAPMIEAQLVETFLLNQVHFHSVAATKAARVVTAAQGRAVVDFGSRRAHGLDAAVTVARATYLAGGAGTSNVLAGQRFGIPIFGTMAHSYVQAHHDESIAFEHFAQRYPGTTLLVDTYDTLAGLDKVIELATRQRDPIHVGAIRLDSGDLLDLAKQARQKLDDAELGHVKVFVSSELDEYAITDLLEAGAPIDGFGAGTRLAVSSDVTDLDVAYKLVEYEGEPRMKLSSDKAIYPGRKQVYRRTDHAGVMRGDTLATATEKGEGAALLQPAMTAGAALPRPSLEASREHTRKQLDALPEHLRALAPADSPYPVDASAALSIQRDRIAEALREPPG